MKYFSLGLFVVATFINWSKVNGSVTEEPGDVTDTSELDNMHPELYKKHSNVDLKARRSARTDNLDEDGDNERESMTDDHDAGGYNRRAFGADNEPLSSDLNDYFTGFDNDADELGRNTHNYEFDQNPSESDILDSILQEIALPIKADAGSSAAYGPGLEQGLNNESTSKIAAGLDRNTRVKGFLESMINELEAEDNENLRNAENLGKHNFRIRDEGLDSLEETRPFLESIIQAISSKKISPKKMNVSSKMKPGQADKIIAELDSKKIPHKENHGISSLAKHPFFSGAVNNKSFGKHPMVANIKINVIEKHYPHQPFDSSLSYPSEAFNIFPQDALSESYSRAPPINALYNMGSKTDLVKKFLGRLPFGNGFIRPAQVKIPYAGIHNIGKGFIRPAQVEIPYVGIQNIGNAFGRPDPFEEAFLRPSDGMGSYNMDINQINPYNILGIGKSFGRSPHIGNGLLSLTPNNLLHGGFYDLNYNSIYPFGHGSASYSPDNMIYSSPFFNKFRKSNDSSLRNSEAFDIDLDDDLDDKK